MSSEYCGFKAKIFIDDLKLEEVDKTISDITTKLGVYSVGTIGKVVNGYSYTVTAECESYGDEKICYGSCLKNRFGQMGPEAKVETKGTCMQER